MTPPDEIASRRERAATTAAARMPDRVPPMLADSAAEPFDSQDHIFELLWGGIRAAAYVHDGHVRLRGANGCDLTDIVPELADIPDLVTADNVILDGEIVALDSQGVPSFDLLRARLHALYGDRGGVPFKFKRLAGHIAFQSSDILWLDGRSLQDRPLWQRKNRLHEVIARPSAEFAAVDFVDDEGTAFFDAVLQRRLDGIVAKQKVSLYTPGRRSQAWLEIRALQAIDVVVGGYTLGATQRRGDPFGQLLLGAWDRDVFRFVGAVSGGLTDAEARQLIGLLEPIGTDLPAFAHPPEIARLICWTRPEMVCRVRFSEWTRDRMLRFPIFSALRPDIDARSCLLEHVR